MCAKATLTGLEVFSNWTLSATELRDRLDGDCVTSALVARSFNQAATGRLEDSPNKDVDRVVEVAGIYISFTRRELIVHGHGSKESPCQVDRNIARLEMLIYNHRLSWDMIDTQLAMNQPSRRSDNVLATESVM